MNRTSTAVAFDGVAVVGVLKIKVRAQIGTLLEVGSGKLKAKEMSAVLAARDRSAARHCAPHECLYLDQVVYPAGLLGV